MEAQVGSWDTAYQRVSAAAIAGQAPDIMFVIPDFALTVRELGIAQPVTDLVRELDAEHRFVTAATVPYSDGGEYWAVPLFGMQQMLWYRRDLFREAGISEPPRTWEQLLSGAQRLAAEGDRYGIAVPAGRNLASDQVIYSLMVTSGAERIFDDDCNVTFNTPETVRALELYRRLVALSPPDATSFAWGEPQALFNAGEAAMAIEKGQYLGPFEEESGRPPEDLGMAPVPMPSTGGRDGTIYYSNGAMILTDDPQKKEAAEELIRFILSRRRCTGRSLRRNRGFSSQRRRRVWNHRRSGTIRSSPPIVMRWRRWWRTPSTANCFGFTGGNTCPAISAISQQNLIAQTVQQMVGL